MSRQNIQLFFSIFFFTAYFTLLGFILYVETSDSKNMATGENSMMGELQLLLGVLTAGAAQILNFWFGKSSEPLFKKKKSSINEEQEDAMG